MPGTQNEELTSQIVSQVKKFVDQEVIPVASKLESADEYPTDIVEQMRTMGLFSCTISEEYGGMGLPFEAYAGIVEEVARGWMSLGGVLNTHIIVSHMVETFGSDAQKSRFLPLMAEGEKRCGLCITEPNTGSDVQAIETTAVKNGNNYLITGDKLYVTNAKTAQFFAVLAKTDTKANPPYSGISCFIVEKGTSGLSIGQNWDKMGYKGVETCELIFDNASVPKSNLLGENEGQGFRQVMSGLEVGRINIGARAVGVARAAFEDAINYSQQRKTFGKAISDHQAIQLKLAEMYTKIQAARQLVSLAAKAKDRGDRCDLEAGMAKLFATETAHEVTMDAMRIFGGIGYTKATNVERYFRDAPLMIVAEGTNEIQKVTIARNLLKMYKI